LADLATLLRGSARRGAGEIRQAGEVALLQHERVSFLVRQHVLAELGAQAGQPLIDRRQPVLACLIERGAGPHESGVIAIKYPDLLRRQAKRIAPGMEAADAGIERPVKVKHVAVAGEQRRDVPLDGLQGIGGVGPGQDVEHICDTIEVTSALLQGLDGVGEGRGRRVGGDGVDLGTVAHERLVESGTEMLRLYTSERRQIEWAGPAGEQGIFAGGGGR
jgi:hypothetical protein